MTRFRESLRSFLATYRVLICLGVVCWVAQLGYGTMTQSAIPPYVKEIGLTAYLGFIFSTFLVAETIFKSPMGSLGDRIGQRPLIVGGALLSAATALAMVFADKLWLLFVLRGLDGIGAAAIWPTMVAAMSGCVAKNRRATAMSVMIVTYIAGLALGPLFGGLANDYTDSRLTSFYLVSFLFLATAAIAYFLTPHRSQEDMEVRADTPTQRIRASDLIAGIRSVPDMVLLVFVAFFGIGLLIPIVKLFAMDGLGMSESGYGKLVFPIALGVAVVGTVSGRLGDHWGKARSVKLGLLITVVAMWSITVAQAPWHFAVAGMFLGIGFVVAMPAWLALVSDMAAPGCRGAVVGTLGTAQGLGAILGAPLGSYLYESVDLNLWGVHMSSYYSPFVASAVALSICLVVSLFFVKDGDERRIKFAREASTADSAAGESAVYSSSEITSQ